MKSPNGRGDVGPSTQDPVRWADMPAETLGPVSKLLVSPAPIKALPSDVAMRVRANVLRSPVPTAASESGSLLTRHAASLKLGGIAVGAALFGAGAMTALSSAQDPDALRVVIAPTSSLAPEDTNGRLNAGDVRTATSRAVVVNFASERVGAGEEERANTTHVDSTQKLGATQQPPSANRSPSAPNAASLDESQESAPPGRERASETSIAEEHDERGAVSNTAQQPNVARTAKELQQISQEERNGALDGVVRDQDFDLLTQAEVIDRPVVRPQFRRVTTARKSIPRPTLSSLEEETLLLEEARGKLGRAPDAALALALEHQSRFRQGQLLEQRRMIHLEALLRLGRDEEAKKLAGSIGSSIYQARANALLVRYGIVAK